MMFLKSAIILVILAISAAQFPPPQKIRRTHTFRPPQIQVRYDQPYDPQYEYPPQYDQQPVNIIGEAFAGFTGDTYTHILQNTRSDQNKVYSPWGIHVLLGMLLAGTGGDTAAEIQNALRLYGVDNATIFQQYGRIVSSLQQQSDVQLVSANKLYLQKSFTPNAPFVRTIMESFGGETEVTDFVDRAFTSQIVNRWVSSVTHGKIQDLVSPDSISVDTLAMLVNGIYFKGKWAWPFNPQRTMDLPFYYDTDRNYSTYLPMMEGFGDFLHGDIPALGAQAVVLPYTGNRFAMVLLLPKDPSMEAFSNLEKYVGRGFDFAGVVNPNMLAEAFSMVRVPKFKIESDINFVEEGILEKLGIVNVIGRGTTGPDMTGISDEPGLYVDSVYQKTVIEMTEDGTEASSGSVATAVRRVSPKTFNANRPFLGYVVDTETKTVLFFFRKVK